VDGGKAEVAAGPGPSTSLVVKKIRAGGFLSAPRAQRKLAPSVCCPIPEAVAFKPYPSSGRRRSGSNGGPCRRFAMVLGVLKGTPG